MLGRAAADTAETAQHVELGKQCFLQEPALLCFCSQHATHSACSRWVPAVEAITAQLAEMEQRVHSCSEATKQLRIEAVTRRRPPQAQERQLQEAGHTELDDKG